MNKKQQQINSKLIKYSEAHSGILPHLDMLTTSLQFVCQRIPGICNDQYQHRSNKWISHQPSQHIQFYTNNLDKVCSHSRQAPTYSIFKHFNTRRVFNFCRYHARNFQCKILTVFLKKSVTLNYSLILWQEKYYSLLYWKDFPSR